MKKAMHRSLFLLLIVVLISSGIIAPRIDANDDVIIIEMNESASSPFEHLATDIKKKVLRHLIRLYRKESQPNLAALCKDIHSLSCSCPPWNKFINQRQQVVFIFDQIKRRKQWYSAKLKDDWAYSTPDSAIPIEFIPMSKNTNIDQFIRCKIDTWGFEIIPSNLSMRVSKFLSSEKGKKLILRNKGIIVAYIVILSFALVPIIILSTRNNDTHAIIPDASHTNTPDWFNASTTSFFNFTQSLTTGQR